MTDLSVIIPSRNEMFLGKTIQDLLDNIRGDTEIIVVLDGVYPSEPIPVHPKVSMIYHSESVGQRAAMNEAAKISTAKYIAKVDAHCAFDEGFDVKLMADMQDDWTVAPIMRNLHVFDWVCKKCGERRYQGPTPISCPKCDNTTEFEREIVWIAKTNPQSMSYCFDSEPHFQYFGEFTKRPEGQGDLTESMSLQGSFFMLTREKYFELNICDEEFGSWGSQGLEVAIKTWLSGGKVMINHKTWYAHMFRTQGGDFGFPYPLSGHQVQHAKKTARQLFFENEWPKQKYPLSWLVKKFWPVKGWTEDDLKSITKNEKIPTVGIVYYTDNQLDNNILLSCQKQLEKSGLPIVSVSLKPLEFGDNIVLDLERGYLTMFKQILAGLEALDTDIVFLVEHDVLYHPSHFDFIPPQKDRYYYNLNCWKVRLEDGHALKYDTKQTSQLCAYRELLIRHYRERIRRVEQDGFSRKMGFEPGSHHRSERVDDYKSDVWNSNFPNLDIRHSKNLTSSRWSKEQFRDQRNCRNWQEAEEVVGWYKVGEFASLIRGRIE
jgi:glycosyltransferase involved in cell wall biosynthesis